MLPIGVKEEITTWRGSDQRTTKVFKPTPIFIRERPWWHGDTLLRDHIWVLLPCKWLTLNESFKLSGLSFLVYNIKQLSILSVKIMIFQCKQNLPNKRYTSKYLKYISCSKQCLDGSQWCKMTKDPWNQVWEPCAESIPAFVCFQCIPIATLPLSKPLFVSYKESDTPVGLVGCTSSLSSIPTE